MNCRKCGNLLNNGDKFCTECGEPVVIEQIGEKIVQEGIGQVVNNESTNQLNVPSQQINQSPIQPQSQQPIQPETQQRTNQFSQQTQQQTNQMTQQPQPTTYENHNQNLMTNNVVAQSPKKKNTGFMIIVIILLLAILGLGTFIGYKVLFSNDTQQVDDKKSDNKNVDDKINNPIIPDDNKETPIVSDNKNVFESYGYKFNIPSELKYNINDNILSLTDNATFQTNFYLENYSYSVIRNNPTLITNELEAIGATVYNGAEGLIDGKNFYLFAVEYADQALIFYITEIDSYYCAFGLITATTTDAYGKSLEYISNMVSGAKKTSTFAPSETDPKQEIKINIKEFENSEINGVEYPIQ